MSRLPRTIFAALVLLAAPLAASAQEVLSPEEESLKRLGFYFTLSLENTSQRGMANGIGVLVDRPSLAGQFETAGPEIDGDFDDRFNFGFSFGFRLRNDKGKIEASYFQFDEGQDLLTVAPDGKRIANTLTDPGAGFSEDVGCFACGNGGPPDGSVRGWEGGFGAEQNEIADQVKDGAEDWNYNGVPDFIRFETSERIVGSIETDLKLFDVDYIRPLKRMRRFDLHGRVGLRLASLSQVTDLAYRDPSSFAVFNDTEEDNMSPSQRPCGRNVDGRTQDGDGDGDDPGENEMDGDGFMNGDCDGQMPDRLQSVETVSEDRIVARIDTQGWGLRMGVDGQYRLGKKWTLSGGMTLNLMSTDVEYRYVETFISERDAYLNYIDWDFNGDGVYDNFDLDFDGSCANLPEGTPCVPSNADSVALNDMGGIETLMRNGIADSVVTDPSGLSQSDPYSGSNFGTLRRGDPIPESERNRDVLREVTLLNDVAGKEDGFTPMLDLNIGAEYQFSRFARLDFGLRASRWFGAGRFRSLANDVIAGGEIDAMDGDFTTDGYYVRLTVVPR